MRDTLQTPLPFKALQLAFIGGGNMASAIAGGLVRQGFAAGQIQVVDPSAPMRERLQAQWPQMRVMPAADALAPADVVIWAVKPQMFAQAARQAAALVRQALHVSVAAGIGSDSIARWLGTGRIVRAMPNTPALVGQGATGLYARADVSAAEKALVQNLLQPTGLLVWVEQEQQLDAVTAISGSGPAYVFYFLEAMEKAGAQMGLPAGQARQLAIATFQGAASLAAGSDESLATLRERVTSKGGTTFAALQTLAQHNVDTSFAKALLAARDRAAELGREFGSQA